MPKAYDPKEGFLLKNVAVFDSGVLICSATTDNFETEEIVSYHLQINRKLYSICCTVCFLSLLFCLT